MRSRRLMPAAAGVLSLAVLSAVSRAVDFQGVMSAALDQPQINTTVLDANGNPVSYQVDNWQALFDPTAPAYVNTINIPAILDTGASGILFSVNTNVALGLSPATYNSQTIEFTDAGVAGSDNFWVSNNTNLKLANFVPTVNEEDPASYTTPVSGVRLQLAHQAGAIAPSFTVPTTGGGALDDLLNLFSVTQTIDVVGMPALINRTMVIDPTPLNSFNFDALVNAINDPTVTDLPQLSVNTYVYPHGTPETPGTPVGNPGVPNTSLHLQLHNADFSAYTLTTPSGATGPTLTHNPFVGNPFDNSPGNQGVGLTGPDPDHAGQTKTVNARMLWDSGAAASIISSQIAAAFGVSIVIEQQPDPNDPFGTSTVDVPVLYMDGAPIADQFNLPISGIGGTSSMAGFFLDDLLLRTMEGTAAGDDNLNIHFPHAPVLVGDITVYDANGVPFTLDGILGMNFFLPSADFSGDLATFDTALSPFRWITFDEQTGIVGLQPIPEPASLGLLGLGAVALLKRRRR